MKYIILFCLTATIFSCSSKPATMKTTGSIERIDSSLNDVIATNATIEIIAEGFDWSEGPLWLPTENALIFSDVPANTIYKWTEEKGKEIYLKPSGFTGKETKSKEPGSNGLILDKNGQLVLCQHGDRQMAKMNTPVGQPSPQFTSIASRYNGKRFSSPNDAVYHSNGELYFTDPPYGLPSQDDNDPERELPVNGVYKVKANGEVILLVDSITRPNGIAFFPGGNKIIIACSDPARPYWYSYDVAGDSLINGTIFYDAGKSQPGTKGLPDGLKIDKNGNVFASGPGGVWIFNQQGTLLGKIKLDEACSNIALSPDEKTMYVTNDMQVLRIRLKN